MKHLEKRFGITTGTCAASAAKAACLAVCGYSVPAEIDVPLPDGRRLSVPVQSACRLPDGTGQGVVLKHSNEDEDVTDGVQVIAHLSPLDDHGTVVFEAGEGVGVVRKPGLQIPVGEPAINPTPRAMITLAMREVTDRSFKVTVSIPGGDRIAQRTFNPRLGIMGGLSILGTTGIVRPHCVKAMRDAISCALNVAEACGVRAPVFVPGNIGWRASFRHFNLSKEQVIEAGNNWKFLLGEAVRRPFQNWLILGHPGKLAKFIFDQWDTHSADSVSALISVRATAEKVCGGQVDADSTTVEGFLSRLPMSIRKKVANELAARICRRITLAFTPNAEVSALLCDMKGEELGRYGDFSIWQKSGT